MEDLNRQALCWCREVDEKIYHTTGKISLQGLERENLQELPPQETLNKYRWEARIVTRDGMVSFDGVRYGVSLQYSGKEVRVRPYAPVIWKTTMARRCWPNTRRTTVPATLFSCKGSTMALRKGTGSLFLFHALVRKAVP